MVPDIKELESSWQEKYPECPPISDALRLSYKDRWVRFHALPNSKRYPDNEEEYEIVLDRHNTLINELNTGDSIFVITSEWSEGQDRHRESSLDSGAIYWQSFPEEPDDPEVRSYRHLFISIKEWRTGVVDEILRSVASDESGGVIIAAEDFSWLYAPYDGGVDVILPSTEDRDAFKNRHAGWLSSNPEGL
jgi:hypothetical protein